MGRSWVLCLLTVTGTLAAQTAQCCSEGDMKWSGKGIRMCLKHGTFAMVIIVINICIKQAPEETDWRGEG